jgi:hypothetical protein
VLEPVVVVPVPLAVLVPAVVPVPDDVVPVEPEVVVPDAGRTS